MQRKHCRSRVEKLVIFSARDNQRVRMPIMTSGGLRADTLLEMSNDQQSEPQLADFESTHERIRHLPRPVFIYCVGACSFISK